MLIYLVDLGSLPLFVYNIVPLYSNHEEYYMSVQCQQGTMESSCNAYLIVVVYRDAGTCKKNAEL